MFQRFERECMPVVAVHVASYLESLHLPLKLLVSRPGPIRPCYPYAVHQMASRRSFR